MEAVEHSTTHNTQQLFENLVADGLSQSDVEKLKLLVPETQGKAEYLTQTFGLSSEDSEKLALGIHFCLVTLFTTLLLLFKQLNCSLPCQFLPNC